MKTIDDPNPPFGEVTVPFGINKAGTVVGGLWVINLSFCTFSEGGWIWVNGKFSNLNPFQPQRRRSLLLVCERHCK